MEEVIIKHAYNFNNQNKTFTVSHLELVTVTILELATVNKVIGLFKACCNDHMNNS